MVSYKNSKKLNKMLDDCFGQFKNRICVVVDSRKHTGIICVAKDGQKYKKNDTIIMIGTADNILVSRINLRSFYLLIKGLLQLPLGMKIEKVIIS